MDLLGFIFRVFNIRAGLALTVCNSHYRISIKLTIVDPNRYFFRELLTLNVYYIKSKFNTNILYQP